MESIPTFVARWGGTCPWCGGKVQPGDDASYDYEDRMVHLACGKLGER